MLQGAGLYNLFRQTGGSIGIAILATLIDHRGALHHAYLAEAVTPFSVATQQRLARRWPAGSPRAVSTRATRSRARDELIDGTITAQSAVLAFRDCYLRDLLSLPAARPADPAAAAARGAAARAGATGDAHGRDGGAAQLIAHANASPQSGHSVASLDSVAPQPGQPSLSPHSPAFSSGRSGTCVRANSASMRAAAGTSSWRT